MKRRKLLTTVATGAVAVIVAATATPASATPRTFVVTLVGGAQVTVTVDVPPGTPVDQITFPGLDLPVVSVQEVTPAETPAPGQTPTPGSTPAPAPGSPLSESGTPPRGAPDPEGRQQSGQK